MLSTLVCLFCLGLAISAVLCLVIFFLMIHPTPKNLDEIKICTISLIFGLTFIVLLDMAINTPYYSQNFDEAGYTLEQSVLQNKLVKNH